MTDTQVMAALEPTQILIDALNKIAICKSRAPGDVVDIAQKAIAAWNRRASSPAAEPVAYTGSGSMMALKDGREGYIWPSPADAHPIALYAAPVPPPAGDAEVRKDGSDV